MLFWTLAPMPILHLDKLDDPRLDAYRQMKKSNHTRWADQFIAEGKKLVVQLLHSDFEIDSILTSEKYVDLVKPHLRADVVVYVLPHAICQAVVGVDFHCGMLACGRRKPNSNLTEVLSSRGLHHVIVACVGIQNPDNVGTILRLAAGFGATAVLLGDGCADPFSRRALRVSMGHALSMPIIDSRDAELVAELRRLQADLDFELVATVVSDDAETLKGASVSSRTVLLFGNEDAGLSEEWIEMSDRRVTIPMHNNTDSLNVGVAAGIFLHHFSNASR